MWHVAHTEHRRNSYKILVGTPDRLNIGGMIILKRILENQGYEAVNWFPLAQYRLQCRVLLNTTEKLRAP
jgi:hypothetical protein